MNSKFEEHVPTSGFDNFFFLQRRTLKCKAFQDIKKKKTYVAEKENKARIYNFVLSVHSSPLQSFEFGFDWLANYSIIANLRLEILFPQISFKETYVSLIRLKP